MTNRTPALAFDLYVSTVSGSPTHLHGEDGIGILCGDARYRYSTFTVAGIVPARTTDGRPTATCAACVAVADEQDEAYRTWLDETAAGT